MSSETRSRRDFLRTAVTAVALPAVTIGACSDPEGMTGPGPHPTPYIPIEPGDDVRSILASNPGGEFEFQGVHRVGGLRPTPGQVFHCAPGARLDGSEQITGWTAQQGFWQATGVPVVDDPRPPNLAGNTRVRPIDLDTGLPVPTTVPWTYQGLYVDGQHFRRVASLEQVEDGTWHMDGDGLISLASNPGGVVLMSRVGNAFRVQNAPGVVFGPTMQIDYYASPGRTEYGAVMFMDSPDCRFEGSIHGCYGIALLLFGAGNDRFTFRGSISEAGQAGIVATGNKGTPLADVLLSGQLKRCNIDLWDPGDEAGGFKGLRLLRPVIDNLDASENFGKGVWFDFAVQDAVIASSRADRCSSYGAFIEKVCSVQVDQFTAMECGAAGILLSGTKTGTVTRCTLKNNGGSAFDGQITIRRVENQTPIGEPCDFVPTALQVSDCDLESGGFKLIAIHDLQGRVVERDALSSDLNRFVSGGSAKPFHAGPRARTGERTIEEWQTLGYDAGSVFG